MTDMERQIAELEGLIDRLREIDGHFEDYLLHWPSARVAHHRPHYAIAALQREVEAVRVKTERQARLETERPVREAERQQRHLRDFERRDADQLIANGLIADYSEYDAYVMSLADRHRDQGYAGPGIVRDHTKEKP